MILLCDFLAFVHNSISTGNCLGLKGEGPEIGFHSSVPGVMIVRSLSMSHSLDTGTWVV